jgi:hypothetical protein
LELLDAAESRLLGVADNVHDGDAIETDHLLKVDESLGVAVGVIERGRIVSAVRVGLEEAAPLASGVGVSGDMKED